MIQGGIVAVYGNEMLYKVSSVMLVSKMHDAKSKQQEQKQESGRTQSFGQILEHKKQERAAEKCYDGRTIGYTRFGEIYTCQQAKHEYVR